MLVRGTLPIRKMHKPMQPRISFSIWCGMDRSIRMRFLLRCQQARLHHLVRMATDQAVPRQVSCRVHRPGLCFKQARDRIGLVPRTDPIRIGMKEGVEEEEAEAMRKHTRTLLPIRSEWKMRRI
uniref:Uncharacterized protein n=1 Tax=Cacopsylla melanoneura TaxID=428564 RepID=A0A8D8TPG0_9HEMI